MLKVKCSSRKTSSKYGRKSRGIYQKYLILLCISFWKLCVCYIFIFFLDLNKPLCLRTLSNYFVKIWLIHMKIYNKFHSSSTRSLLSQNSNNATKLSQSWWWLLSSVSKSFWESNDVQLNQQTSYNKRHLKCTKR